MPLHMIREDITRMEVDAIVAAGSAKPGTPEPTGGVNGSIHKKAGLRLLQALRRLGGIKTGGVTLTEAYDLPCRYVIHTAGPIWRGGHQGEEALLRSCYREALQLAMRQQFESIAFPLISSGQYGYPREKALQVATSEIRAFLNEHDMDVYLVVYDRESFRASIALCADVKMFIDQVYVDEHPAARNAPAFERHRAKCAGEVPVCPAVTLDGAEDTIWPEPESGDGQSVSDTDGLDLFGPDSMPDLSWLDEAIERRVCPGPPDEDVPEMQPVAECESCAADDSADGYSEAFADASSDDRGYGRPRPGAAPPVHAGRAGKLFCDQEAIPAGLLRRLRELDEGFSEMLLRLIDEKGVKDSVCYRRANVDRKLFSKIRNTPGYTPKKSTVAAFCVALELDMDMSRELLSRAGYAFSRSNMFDVIVEYFIIKRQYDVDAINQVLFAYDQPLLGSNVG